MVHNNNNNDNNIGSIKNSSKRGGTTVQKRERDEDRYKYNKEQLFWHSRSADTLLGERERGRQLFSVGMSIQNQAKHAEN